MIIYHCEYVLQIAIVSRCSLWSQHEIILCYADEPSEIKEVLGKGKQLDLQVGYYTMVRPKRAMMRLRTQELRISTTLNICKTQGHLFVSQSSRRGQPWWLPDFSSVKLIVLWISRETDFGPLIFRKNIRIYPFWNKKIIVVCSQRSSKWTHFFSSAPDSSL